MDGRRWYEAEALMADLTTHRYEIKAASEEAVGRRMRAHYPAAATILVREEKTEGPVWEPLEEGEEEAGRWPR